MGMLLPEKHCKLFKELYDLKGQKIRFDTTLGLYEGTIDYLLPLNRAVSFKRVYYLPKNEFAGNLRFLLEDFISYEVIEPDEYEKYEKWDYVARILENSSVGPKYKITDIFDDLEEKSSESSVKYPEDIEEEKFVLKLPPDLERKLPNDSFILDTLNTEFQEAIDYIFRQDTIGVAFEGPKISRTGHLSWICMSTPLCIFLFDIELLGKRAFDNGLREIFQDKKIQKVIHNCRLPADCLVHLFATKLTNVFDTQVADYIVNTLRYKGKGSFKYVSSLDSCLRHYLNVPQEFIINRKGYYSYEAELNFFRVRSVSNEYRTVLIKNVVYLLLLKEKLNEFMLSPFRKAVDLNLGVLADASPEELVVVPHDPTEISPTILMHGIQTVRYRENVELPPVPLVYKDPHKGTVKGIYDSTKDETEDILCANDSTSEEEVEEFSSKLNIREKMKTSSVGDSKNPNKFCSRQKCTVNCLKIPHSRRHIDDIYHKLVHDLHNNRISGKSLKVKPSQYLSTFKVTKSFNNVACSRECCYASRGENDSNILYKCNSQSSIETDEDIDTKSSPDANSYGTFEM